MIWIGHEKLGQFAEVTIEVKVRLEWLQGQGQMYHAEPPIPGI